MLTQEEKDDLPRNMDFMMRLLLAKYDLIVREQDDPDGEPVDVLESLIVRFEMMDIESYTHEGRTYLLADLRNVLFSLVTTPAAATAHQ